MTPAWMLYGPTGYTGGLIVQEGLRTGLRPVLAGRDERRLATFSQRTGLLHRTLPLDDHARLVAGLEGMRLVLNCAGPFSRTAAPLRDACIEARVHYLDITGEIDVFEAAHAQDAQAAAAGVLLCPGVGFDVVPTDCVAATLKNALPTATQLDLGFSGLDRMSAGTLATSMEAVYRGCARVRRAGRIVDLPFGEGSRVADFGRDGERSFVIPWGDVATAYHTTGIPDIAVHIPWRSPGAAAIRALLPLRRLLASPFAARTAQSLLRRIAAGPTESERARQRTRIWGEVRDAAGHARSAVLRTPDGYSLTVQTALLAVTHVLEKDVPGGFRTPSQLLGADCLERLGLTIALR